MVISKRLVADDTSVIEPVACEPLDLLGLHRALHAQSGVRVAYRLSPEALTFVEQLPEQRLNVHSVEVVLIDFACQVGSLSLARDALTSYFGCGLTAVVAGVAQAVDHQVYFAPERAPPG